MKALLFLKYNNDLTRNIGEDNVLTLKDVVHM